jgi:hypothetical protein
MISDDVILLSANINFIKRSRDDQFDASKEADASVNAENSFSSCLDTKWML